MVYSCGQEIKKKVLCVSKIRIHFYLSCYSVLGMVEPSGLKREKKEQIKGFARKGKQRH